jgi:hypothetical protein
MRTSWSLTVLLVMLLVLSVSAPAAAGPATHFALSFTAGGDPAGTQFLVTVAAQDAAGNEDPSFTGTVHFTSSDPLATLPPDTPITGHVGVFVTLASVGDQTLTATASGGSITGASTLTVTPGPAQRLTVGFPTLVTAGAPFTFTVTARDGFNNRAASYAGNMQFTSSDADATLPANQTVTTVATNFTARLRSSGLQTITATDPFFGPVFAATATIFVATPATHLQITAPASVIADFPYLVGVRALDADDTLAATDGGTVHFTSTDAQARLPGDVKLVNGQATVQATFDTPGRQTIAAADTASPSIAGTSDPIVVGFVPPLPPSAGPPAPPPGGGPTPGPTPAPAPAIGGLAVKPLCVSKARPRSAPRRGSGKLALSFTLSAGARVSVALERLLHARAPARCPKRAGSTKGAVKLVKTLSGSAVAGRNALAIASRAGRRGIALTAAAKTLAPGAYLAVVRATDATGRRSAPATAKFFVLR